MKTSPRLASAAAVVAILAGSTILGGGPAVAAPPAPCDLRLIIGLTPDVPDPRDLAFLSSLLGNHPGYRLTLDAQRNGSVIVAGLSGPGPSYVCQDLVDALRKDGRVLFVHVHEDSP